ncbi:hypothetical protein MMC28_003581 [Mycoblastus sanguinarius]|nr:hypothetical protein [Mycoblastus sanguinarius]
MATNGTPQEGPQITLHWLEKSRSQRILWLLEECHLPYSIMTYKRDPKTGGNADLAKIHPLGKSPTITIEGRYSNGPIVLIESGAIVEYLCEYFGGNAQNAKLIPDKFPHDLIDTPFKAGLETEEWRRFNFFMHYAEGSIMPIVTITFVTQFVKTAPPFPIRLLSAQIGKRIDSDFLLPQFKQHFDFLESELKAHGGPYICGPNLTAADIMMMFSVDVGVQRALKKADYPRLAAWMEKCKTRPAFQRAVQKVVEVDVEVRG